MQRSTIRHPAFSFQSRLDGSDRSGLFRSLHQSDFLAGHVFFQSPFRNNPARARGTRDQNDVQDAIFKQKRQRAGLRFPVMERRDSVQREMGIRVFGKIRDLLTKKNRRFEGLRKLGFWELDDCHDQRELSAVHGLDRKTQTLLVKLPCCFRKPSAFGLLPERFKMGPPKRNINFAPEALAALAGPKKKRGAHPTSENLAVPMRAETPHLERLGLGLRKHRDRFAEDEFSFDGR